jgi:integrase
VSRKKLTVRFIDSRKKAPTGERHDYADAIVPGLALRVTDRGHKSFVLVARYPLNPKNPTRRALGDYGELTLEQARQKARDWLQLIGRGIDPRIEEERQRAAQQRKQATSFAAVANDFLERHAKGLAKYDDCKTTIEREFVKRWGARPVTDIAMPEVAAAVRAVVARGSPAQAHNSLGYIRRLYSWAIGTGEYGIEASPVDHIRPAELIGKKVVRNRVLADDELRQVWAAADKLNYPYGSLVKMLILSGQRLREVADMSWSEIEIDKALWTIPPARMKGDRAHEVPMAPLAFGLLEGLPRPAEDACRGDFVFSTTGGEKPFNSFSKSKDQIDLLIARNFESSAVIRSLRMSTKKGKCVEIVAPDHAPFIRGDVGRIIGLRIAKKWGYARITAFLSAKSAEARVLVPFKKTTESADAYLFGLQPWVVHDLRRTMRTHLSALPVQDLVRELVIAHARPGLHKVYDLHQYQLEKRRCLELWEQRLKGIVGPPPSDITRLDEERTKRQRTTV